MPKMRFLLLMQELQCKQCKQRLICSYLLTCVEQQKNKRRRRRRKQRQLRR